MRSMVRLGSNGRFVIPSEFRKVLGLAQGAELLVRIVDGELRIATPERAISRARAIVRAYVPAEHSLVDELIAERRAAAAAAE